MDLVDAWEGHLMRQILILVALCCAYPCLPRPKARPAGTGVGPAAILVRPPNCQMAGQFRLSNSTESICSGSPFNTNGLNVSTVRYFGKRFGAEAQVGGGFGNTGATTVP